MNSVVQESDSKDATAQPRIRAGEASGRRGKAIAHGPLSVPVSWSTTAPRIQTASPLSAAANRNTPSPAAGNPMASTYSKGLMALLAGPRVLPPRGCSAGADGTRPGAGQNLTAAGDLVGQPAQGAEPPRIAGPAIVLRVLPGQTVTLPFGSTIALGEGTTMLVDSGFVTVEGPGARIANVPVTVNDGGTVTTLGRCCAAGAVIPSDTRLFAGSYGAFTLTQYRRAGVEVELFSGSATTGAGPRAGEVATPAGRTANAAVGADGATITNVAGTLTVTTRRYPQLRLCNGAPPRS